ncbi:MAG: hypothetical protein Q8O35_03885 [Humidesulfovibrio sp.]|jgi:hypothetical protein|nr:hypothetical protein [Humidesulfovibrio sp.]MDP2847314.1 hypothetical protein [Humidesulfovibrio sp.]
MKVPEAATLNARQSPAADVCPLFRIQLPVHFKKRFRIPFDSFNQAF